MNDRSAREKTPAELRRKRSFLVWGAASGSLVLASIGMMIASSVMSSAVDASLSAEFDAAYAADDRINEAWEYTEAFPDQKRMDRHFREMGEAASSVAALQDRFQQRGERQTTDQYGEPLAPKEQQTQEEADAKLWASAERELGALFEKPTSDEDEGAVAVRDSAQVSSWCVTQGEAVGQWSWTGGRQIDKELPVTIPVVWELTTETGDVVCSVESTWLTKSRMFTSPEPLGFGPAVELVAEKPAEKPEKPKAEAKDAKKKSSSQEGAE